MKVASVRFVRSAAAITDLPRDTIPQLALVGRSNVGKSRLINALASTRVARVSATPGKTRLMNLYRLEVATPARVLYVVDLPGYGYARGGATARRMFDTMARAYFPHGPTAALLVVDARHPGLASDLAAWKWLAALPCHTAVVASKIDKLPRAERVRALELWQTSLNAPVLAVSAVTGEGLEKLRNLIARLASRRTPHQDGAT
ncbi:MAG: ribosome biogenesis GTP-binding protein YsxC [Luteitalea sp.]|nr:ribosome biogenesis GTP-binding protein YsxC [Luteitalea sp.]